MCVFLKKDDFPIITFILFYFFIIFKFSIISPSCSFLQPLDLNARYSSEAACFCCPGRNGKTSQIKRLQQHSHPSQSLTDIGSKANIIKKDYLMATGINRFKRELDRFMGDKSINGSYHGD